MVSQRTRSAICATGWFFAICGWCLYLMAALALVSS
jgi:hypothetical protein